LSFKGVVETGDREIVGACVDLINKGSGKSYSVALLYALAVDGMDATAEFVEKCVRGSGNSANQPSTYRKKNYGQQLARVCGAKISTWEGIQLALQILEEIPGLVPEGTSGMEIVRQEVVVDAEAEILGKHLMQMSGAGTVELFQFTSSHTDGPNDWRPGQKITAIISVVAKYEGLFVRVSQIHYSRRFVGDQIGREFNLYRPMYDLEWWVAPS
jgi:hypothetical protein